MDDFSTERLEPTARVPEVPAQQPRREAQGRPRRRAVSPPAPAEPDAGGEPPEQPPHQLDRLA